jgi:hypothetical protein
VASHRTARGGAAASACVMTRQRRRQHMRVRVPRRRCR